MSAEGLGVGRITEKSLAKEPLTQEEVLFLFSLRDERQIAELMLGARKIRAHFFGEEIFLTGFVYFSTFCRNFCSFCHYSASYGTPRYRKTTQEVLDICGRLRDSGVHLIDLTMGEDPLYLADGAGKLLELIGQITQEIDVPLMISPGLVEVSVLKRMAEMGVAWYACYQETFNRAKFQTLRVGQEFEKRMSAKRKARELHLLVEEGVLLEVGEETRDLISAAAAIQSLGAEQVRAMTYVRPGHRHIGSSQRHHFSEEMVVAIFRHIFPEKLIPASLDVAGLDGLSSRLEAGANVVSSIIPSGVGLKGVCQTSLDIADGRRAVENVRHVLSRLNLAPARPAVYQSWLRAARERRAENQMLTVGIG